jgi:hypothetical protein
MKEHLAGQDGDAAVLFNRGARIAKRLSEPTTKEAMEFVPVRVDEATTAGASSRCRFRHAGGHELEFTELPEVTWLAALFSALSSEDR